MTATIVAAQQLAIPGEAPSLPATEIVKQGPHDTASARELIAVCEALPLGSTHRQAAAERRRGLKSLLRWLESFPGNGWAQRWQASGADDGERWLQDRIAGDNRGRSAAREELNRGLGALLLGRIVLPGYGFLAEYKGRAVYDLLPQVISPDGFARLERHASGLKITARHLDEARMILCRIILHTGRDLEQLTESDVLGFREWFKLRDGRTKFGLHGAWDLLVALGVLPVGSSLSKVSRMGQRSAAELVARHNIQCAPVRDLLIRYLNERRPALDYGTFQGLAGLLAGTFWADLEAHHPGLDSIGLPADVASAWKQRLRTVSNPDGSTRERRGYLDVLIRVRSFYLDLQEWALQDPSWAQWAVPCPIRKSDTAGLLKARRKVIAEIHQRTRERLPYLAVLVDAADRHRREQTGLLTAAAETVMDAEFTHGGKQYRRSVHKSYAAGLAVAPGEIVIAEDLASGKRLNLSKAESDAFWAWAAIEVLRQTGVRIEELLEITHLALIAYTLPDTGEVVPLLQVVPSKSDEERLLLVTPELASVLAQIIARVRNAEGIVPLVRRYDDHECILGPALPHLFQRKQGWRDTVITDHTIMRLLRDTVARAGLVDRTGKPLHYTPHDFRRMFATEAVTGGLPVHIAARILGHHSLSTTQGYLAVFQDELIRAYRSFVDNRRTVRPADEYREPTDQEWAEFQQHFQLRKLELGTCGRPYGTPCQHEHACIRCPMLRVDPAARGRLADIISNLGLRITEAQQRGWLGEVQGLQISLDAARTKLTALDRAHGPVLVLSRAPIRRR